MVSQNKIMGLILLVITVMGFGYMWITDIQPDLDRIAKINEKTRESNEKIWEERAASYDLDEQFPDCWYDEEQKVRVCN